jgi:hypothetical protein
LLKWIALILLAAVSSNPAAAQLVEPATQPQQRTRFRAHLITMSPGQLVYERFGHNAIFITDYTSGGPMTTAYDFGNFDFNEADFVRRFVFGEMRYWAAEKEPEELLTAYAVDNRQIFRQELNLTDDQVQQLWINLRENIREENRFYHYDYYTDNCSTRLRDHIDRVTGGQVAAQLKSRPALHNYRWHTRVGMDRERLLLAGIEFTAAEPVDRPMSRWEEGFLPEQLRQGFDETTIRAPDGQVVPLVRNAAKMNQYINAATFVEMPTEPMNPLWWFALCGALTGALLAWAGAFAARFRRGRWVAAVLWGGWGLIAGLGGALLVFMWAFTRHVATYANENLLQLSPFAMLMIVFGPMAAFGRSIIAARWLARGLVAMCLLGVMLKALPGWRQDNAAVIAFALLSQAGLLAGMLMRVPTVLRVGKDSAQ